MFSNVRIAPFKLNTGGWGLFSNEWKPEMDSIHWYSKKAIFVIKTYRTHIRFYKFKNITQRVHLKDVSILHNDSNISNLVCLNI